MVNGFDGRFGSIGTQATVRLYLFSVMGALEGYRANLRIHARGPGRAAHLAGLFVILKHERVV